MFSPSQEADLRPDSSRYGILYARFKQPPGENPGRRSGTLEVDLSWRTWKDEGRPQSGEQLLIKPHAQNRREGRRSLEQTCRALGRGRSF